MAKQEFGKFVKITEREYLRLVDRSAYLDKIVNKLQSIVAFNLSEAYLKHLRLLQSTDQPEICNSISFMRNVLGRIGALVCEFDTFNSWFDEVEDSLIIIEKLYNQKKKDNEKKTKRKAH